MIKIDQDRVIEAIEQDDDLGFCLGCGTEAFGVEPDAQGYECEECGENLVFGAEEILLMGEVE